MKHIFFIYMSTSLPCLDCSLITLIKSEWHHQRTCCTPDWYSVCSIFSSLNKSILQNKPRHHHHLAVETEIPFTTSLVLLRLHVILSNVLHTTQKCLRPTNCFLNLKTFNKIMSHNSSFKISACLHIIRLPTCNSKNAKDFLELDEKKLGTFFSLGNYTQLNF